MNSRTLLRWSTTVALLALSLLPAAGADVHHSQLIRALFLGDDGHHKPADRFKQLQPVMAARGIELNYTDSLGDLNPSKLAGFDCVVIYANHTAISSKQESALLDFVAGGGGFVPLHCASYCFLNSPKYIELVGGQFKSHGTGTFKETIVKADHPVMKGVSTIESWDESYVHAKHNNKRTVLSERRDDKGAEPYTWVREHGKGRVFYTAWGHDQRTWSVAGFQTLVENGIRWVSAGSPTLLKPHTGLKPFEYIEAPAPLPNYVANARWGTQTDPIRTMQKPLDPAESLKHVVNLPGFRTSLVAAEPDITKPIWLTWDERGRLWIAETVDYPNDMQPDGQGHDQIKICEDTNGDGRMDKFTVFVDKLSVPTGFVFARGGIIVIHSGRMEFFKDTNGDDKTDVREVLISGWGTRDTHAGPSNLRYGFDNWIWGTVGYSGFDGTVGGKSLRFGQGIFRFKPDGSVLEFVRSSNNNTWGLGFSEDGTVFGSTANGNASMYMPIPNRYYEAVNGWSASRLESIADSQQFYPITEKVRQVDWHGKYTAGAGSALYTARSFPKDYWNRAQFVAEPTGHVLGMFRIEPHGADYIAHNDRNFSASDDEWSSPIAAEVGPDGALWVIDWYNYIIQHNPTPQGFKNGKGNAYDTPLRDKIHGRIHRMSYVNARASAPQRLDKSTPKELVAALKNDNLLWRQHAQRLLVDRGDKDVVPALQALIDDKTTDELGLNVGAIHALWTLHGIGAMDGDDGASAAAAVKALKHPSAAVRRAALAVLPRKSNYASAIVNGKLLDDADAQVRLVGLLALAEISPAENAGKAVYAMLKDERNSDDRWIPDAAASAAARHDAGFLTAVLGSFKPSSSSTGSEPAPNLLSNASFENERDGKPLDWRTVIHGGKAEFRLADKGHTGSRSVMISSEQGGDASWAARVTVKPRTEYRLSAWIRTEKFSPLRGARGALLNIHELQDPVAGATKPVTADSDWTMVAMTFNTGQMTEVTVNCLLGGWGFARGTAWFDDIELKQAESPALPGELGRVVRVVTTHYAQRGPIDTIVPTLAGLKGASADLALPILDGLASGWPQDKAPTFGEDEKRTLVALMDSLPESARDRMLALAQRWGKTDVFAANVATIIDSLKQQIVNATLGEPQRINAAKRLAGLDDQIEVARQILDQVSLLTSPSLAAGFVTALTESRNSQVGKLLAGHWPQYTPAVRRAAIGAMMRRLDWTTNLLDAVEKGGIARGELAAEHWSQLKQSRDKAIARRADRLAAIGATTSADREEIVKKLLPLAKEKGDATRGKEVFATSCAVCHTFNGQGGKVGPDLTGISARDRGDILLEILDPNRSLEANYRMWTVSTKSGDTYSGRLETETQTSVEILDTTGQKHVVQRSAIASLEGSQLSIMPNGFESLPENDLKSLIEYLAQAQH